MVWKTNFDKVDYEEGKFWEKSYYQYYVHDGILSNPLTAEIFQTVANRL